MRLPSWSQPGPTRPSKNGTMPPAWWVMILRLGSRSNVLENTSRAIIAEVSYGQPKVHQISYSDRLSLW